MINSISIKYIKWCTAWIACLVSISTCRHCNWLLITLKCVRLLLLVRKRLLKLILRHLCCILITSLSGHIRICSIKIIHSSIIHPIRLLHCHCLRIHTSSKLIHHHLLHHHLLLHKLLLVLHHIIIIIICIKPS